MIPKIIHYCWFGNNPLPDSVKCYINTWRKYCPDYRIIEWNEKNFDLSISLYATEAYNSKKWAFVSDYVRLFALYNYGGIYLDTDVEVIKNFDDQLRNKAFFCFETVSQISTGIIGSEEKTELLKSILDKYQNRRFIKDDGSFDLLTNVDFISSILKNNYNLAFENRYQNLNDFVVYPSDYFSPKDNLTGKINLTQNTICIHHFDGTWVPTEYKDRIKLQQTVYSRFGKNKFSNVLLLIYFFLYRIKKNGFISTIKYYTNRKNHG